MLSATKIGEKIQAAYDWLLDLVDPIENRWIIFSLTVGLLLIFRALGAAGLSDIIALVYVMYWVTFNRPESPPRL